MMVNYLYDLQKIEASHEQFVNGEVAHFARSRRPDLNLSTHSNCTHSRETAMSHDPHATASRRRFLNTALRGYRRRRCRARQSLGRRAGRLAEPPGERRGALPCRWRHRRIRTAAHRRS
jgi:hypothetical protein